MVFVCVMRWTTVIGMQLFKKDIIMTTIRFSELFGVAIQNALHVRKEVKLAKGESLDIEIRLPKDGEGEFAIAGVISANIASYVFLDCLFEVFDKDGKRVTTKDADGNTVQNAHKIIPFFINTTGVEPPRYAGFKREDGNIYGLDRQVKFWFKTGGMYVVRVTNTGGGNGILPMRVTSTNGINVPVPMSLNDIQVSARLDQLEKDFYKREG